MKNTDLIKFHNCCKSIIDAKCNPGSMMNYAKTYARNGLKMSNDYDIKSQIPYILSNLNYWRGKEAKIVKSKLSGILSNIN